MKKINISVVICCYNSEKLIKDTLRHLAKQRLKSSLSFEVILVDNNSTDDTVEVAKKLWQDSRPDIPFNNVEEKKPGLSHARKTGVLASNGEVIVFCDDDNWLEVNYLNSAFEIMKTHPEIGALGGQSVGILETEEPSWWQSKCLGYAVGKQALQNGDISKRGFVWGAGLVIPRSILISLYDAGFNSMLSDRKGKILNSGGDSEICKWILLMGYKLWYSDELKFTHYIKKERLTDEYVKNLYDGHYNSQHILSIYDWFIKENIQHFIGNSSLKDKIYFLTKILKHVYRRNKKWKYYLQVILGSTIKVSYPVYYISGTLKNLTS